MNINKVVDNIDARIDSRLPQTVEAIQRRKKHILRPAAAIAIGASLFGGYKVYEANQDATFSSHTIEHVLQQGEGLNDAALDIEGIDTIDIRDATNYIAKMEQNKSALEDGLKEGEQLIVPEKVESD